jgi:hypothetical protein
MNGSYSQDRLYHVDTTKMNGSYSQDRLYHVSDDIDRILPVDQTNKITANPKRHSFKPPMTVIILSHEPAHKKVCRSSLVPTSEYQDSCSDLSHTSLNGCFEQPLASKKHFATSTAIPVVPKENVMHSRSKQILQIGPDFWVYLREAEETLQALRTKGGNSLQVTTCSCCSERVACVRDAEFVKCPQCNFTNLNGNRLCHGGGGLAVGINVKDLK